MAQGATFIEVPEVTETRGRPRYNLLTTIEAQFAGQAALVRNLSANGVGLRHAAQVRVGSTVSVKIEAPENESALSFRCRVVWSRLSRFADERGKPFYDSGLTIVDDSPAAAGLMGRLIRAYGVRDAESLEAKRRVLEERALARAGAQPGPRAQALPRITPDQVLLIREAQEFLANDPEKTARWHERAKQSLVALGLVSPDAKSSPHRRDALVIWEYLGRTLDLDVVSLIAGLRSEG
ncbi:MAG: PilZ domain-containing protein [Acidobacteria bacterium]|nr:PilZ domain-containing protein [Acidobacteriota bacterium]